MRCLFFYFYGLAGNLGEFICNKQECDDNLLLSHSGLSAGLVYEPE